jgi:hypothetical protein
MLVCTVIIPIAVRRQAVHWPLCATDEPGNRHLGKRNRLVHRIRILDDLQNISNISPLQHCNNGNLTRCPESSATVLHPAVNRTPARCAPESDVGGVVESPHVETQFGQPGTRYIERSRLRLVLSGYVADCSWTCEEAAGSGLVELHERVVGPAI